MPREDVALLNRLWLRDLRGEGMALKSIFGELMFGLERDGRVTDGGGSMARQSPYFSEGKQLTSQTREVCLVVWSREIFFDVSVSALLITNKLTKSRRILLVAYKTSANVILDVTAQIAHPALALPARRPR